jgi:hypothetical protein
MRSFEEQAQETQSRLRLYIALAAAAVLLLVLGALLLVPGRKPTEPPTATPTERAAPPVARAPEAPAEPGSAPASPARPRARREKPPPAAEAPPPSAGPTLRIESDIAGASVFVDRQYLGETPITTTAVAPGTHQLNASAEGHDGIVQTIEVGESGATEITIRFREVKLNEAISVVHKHAMGRCQGRLVADVAGLRYETGNKGDAFALPWAQMEIFEVNYLEKNLKVKRRGGKTWNFTDEHDNADALFVFHRDVTKARQKLAGQGGQS